MKSTREELKMKKKTVHLPPLTIPIQIDKKKRFLNERMRHRKRDRDGERERERDREREKKRERNDADLNE